MESVFALQRDFCAGALPVFMRSALPGSTEEDPGIFFGFT